MRDDTLAITAAVAALAFSNISVAADQAAPGARAPSAAGIAACNGKAEGAAVNWVGRAGTQRIGKCTMVDKVPAGRMGRSRAATGDVKK